MAKDETMIGITGLPIPKKKMSPAKQHEFEKKRRANLGTNVGGEKYKKDVTPGYNPRTRTFEEFMSIAEAVSASDRKLAASGILSKRADDLQREIDAVKSGKKPAAPNKSARRIAKQDYQVKEESNVTNEDVADVVVKAADWVRKGKSRHDQAVAQHKEKQRQKKIPYAALTAEAKVEAGKSEVEKRAIRTARSGLTGSHADYERRGAHREADELNKDAKDIRRGKLNQPQFQGRTGQERIAAVKKAKGIK